VLRAAEAGAKDARKTDGMMNVDVIKQILELMREHDLSEFELEEEGLKIRIRKPGAVPVIAAPLASMPQFTAVPAPQPALASAAPLASASSSPAGGGADVESLELAVITSPIVGTFYRAPDPSSPNFVEIGQSVRKGQTLCIIEAMKLMNEIESEYEGEIVKVYVENGQPVQYGERMFAIKT
jgi:acetyl-CoA carboxylase biotin carboxyl carrier protein